MNFKDDCVSLSSMSESDILSRCDDAYRQWSEDEMKMRKELSEGRSVPTFTDGGLAKEKGLQIFGRSESFDSDTHTGAFAISTPTIDSYKDVILPQAFDLERYRKNPVVLWNHDSSLLPNGRSIREEIVEDEAIYSEQKFAVGLAPEGSLDFPLQVFNYYKDAMLNSVSVGFFPRQWEKRMVKDEAGNEVWSGGFTFTDVVLAEYSNVTVPSNEDALALSAMAAIRFAKQVGMIDRRGEELGEFGNIVRASELCKKYPELTDEEGLRGSLRKIIREELARAMLYDVEVRRVPNGGDERKGTENDDVSEAFAKDAMSALDSMLNALKD